MITLDRLAYRSKDLTKLLPFSEPTLMSAVKRGDLDALYVGSARIFTAEEVAHWLNSDDVEVVAPDVLGWPVTAFAEVVGLSTSLLYEQINARRLHVELVGSRRMVKPAEARRWLASLPTTNARRLSPAA